jgi:hypothetical protein
MIEERSYAYREGASARLMKRSLYSLDYTDVPRLRAQWEQGWKDMDQAILEGRDAAWGDEPAP